jgi:hypothetical protein
MIQIDLDKLDELVAKSDEIFLTPEGEKVLIKLLEMQKQVEYAITAAKVKLETAALKTDEHFSSIQADKIKVYYRAFGQRYYIDEKMLNLAPKELYTSEEKVVYKINTKAVDKWIDQHGGMPAGITEVGRKKSITFSLKDKNGDTE